MEDFENLLGGNEIFLGRARGVGVLTAAEAAAYSMAGPMLRASGVPYDLRRAAPYSIYDRFEFDVCTRPEGMCGRASVCGWTRSTRASAS